MEHKPIPHSSNVASTAHNPETGKMQVRFHNGGVYEWSGVTDEQHEALRGSSSVGRHLHQNFSKGTKVNG